MKKIILFSVAGIIFIVALAGLFFVYELYTKVNFSGEKELVVNKGESLSEVSQRLWDQKLIKSKLIFEFYLRLKREQGAIQAGTYILTPMNIKELADTLVLGKADNEIVLQFIEGWTTDEMADYLVKRKIIVQKKDFTDLLKIDLYRNGYDFLQGLQENTVEGFLFPDSYRVYKDAKAQDIILKMLDNFDKKLTPALRTEIKAKGSNIGEIVIMASIIEREVPKEEERSLVADVLWRRLKTDMLLQVDSTLNYILKIKNPSLSLDQLKIDSPYNTYKYKGLPPTPISNPGETALRAAIYPKSNEYWYFLSAKDTGETIFSKTYEEHLQAVEKYLK